jgi:transglutaminase-like putative cysteine protease
MKVRVGCEFVYRSAGETPSVWQVRARPEERVVSERWTTDPEVPVSRYTDSFGNLCDRLTLPAGSLTIRYEALVQVRSGTDPVNTEAAQIPVDQLPDEAMLFLLPSRFCLSDLLFDDAWKLFGDTAPGWARVQAVCDWVHDHTSFRYGGSHAFTTSVETFQCGEGVCRDFAQLAVAFCRSLNIPARYVFGYLPDIGVPPPHSPMDFCAWMEVYLGDRWWTFDPRNNVPRTGRVLIGRGRDAADVAMVTTYGAPMLESMTVLADEAA